MESLKPSHLRAVREEGAYVVNRSDIITIDDLDGDQKMGS